MGNLDISQVITTGMRDIDTTSQTTTDFRRVIDPSEQDFPGTRYYPDWAKWFGYYKTVPELQAVIDKKAIWTIGRGFQAEGKVKERLGRIRGIGIDTFDSIMLNMIRQYTICGDAFAEIVRNSRKEIINLKPLNPGTVVIISNDRGMISGYEQVTKSGKKVKKIRFKPDNIFHLAWNRLGDEPHGKSTIEKLVDIIDSKNEAMKDLRIIFHRYVKPLIISMADTDDETELASLKTKLDNAVKNMENLVVPKGSMEMERVSIPQYSTLDPLPWLQLLQRYFITSEGVPEVILGHGSDTTEASSKILYLAFQQNIEYNQLFLEQQCKSQLKMEIEFNFPADIAPEMEQDVRKKRDIRNMEMDKNVREQRRKQAPKRDSRSQQTA